MKNTIKKAQAKIYFKQPLGLHVIAFMTFCLCLCIAPFMMILNDYGSINFFYNRNDHFFVVFFAGIFGCISNYIFGSTKSIIHGLQFIIIAVILSFIKNMLFFASAVLWIGLAIVIVNLLFNLSAFYLKTDIRRIYGFIGVYSSILLGVAIGLFIFSFILKNIFYFKMLYLLVVIFLLIFFLKNSYKLNTTLTSQTERISISFYGVLLIFFIFAFILFYLLINLNFFSIINLIVLPVSLIYLHILTIKNNKENGKNLLKYIYFSLAMVVVNKIFYLNFLNYEHTIDTQFINSNVSTFLFLLISYCLCILIYLGWKFKFISLNIESITQSTIIKTMIYIESIKVFMLVLSILVNNTIISNLLISLATILALILNIFIVPIYFSLGKILAGGKNEIISTTLLYLIFSSLIFVSFLYDIYMTI
ncbi:MAG: hypothetical protein Kow0076_7150 [Francisella sp.]